MRITFKLSSAQYRRLREVAIGKALAPEDRTDAALWDIVCKALIEVRYEGGKCALCGGPADACRTRHQRGLSCP